MTAIVRRAKALHCALLLQVCILMQHALTGRDELALWLSSSEREDPLQQRQTWSACHAVRMLVVTILVLNWPIMGGAN